MPIAIPYDTAAAIGTAATKCESRSLFASRFADPTSEKEDRKVWFQSLIGKKSIAQQPWHPPTATLLHAQLKARLMVNMAGGVMENAGLQLDRYGLPIIPGSAVKGCARRAALAALREWCETGVKPDDEGNLFKDLCAGFTTPAEMLTAIAHTFGWVEKDWSTADADHSDFAWACKQSSETFQEVASQLAVQKQFAGSIAFLDARPNKDPGLVLDVLTPHHTKYYESNNPNAVATDTEDPVPVFFPAIKEQNGVDHFTFPLVPLRRANQSLLTTAQEALRTGLEVFGLGAKTNAGYGWFDASEALNTLIQKEICEMELVSKLETKYANFADWSDEEKEESILELDDRKSDCRIWQATNSPIFNAVQAFAQSQGFNLV
jgi:CRISPR-associated protein Cmr6